MQVESMRLGPLETNCWIVSDGRGGPVVVIDPGGDASELIAALGERTVAAVVLTHAHFDHLGAVVELVESSGALLMAHVDDARRVLHAGADGTGGAIFGFDARVPRGVDRELADGDVIEAGDLVLRVLHAPGHTQGGICLLASDPDDTHMQLFSGDTLFAGSVGRTDFPGGDARVLARSIAEKLAPLAGSTVVHPGHGPDTTIERERRINPFWPRA